MPCHINSSLNLPKPVEIASVEPVIQLLFSLIVRGSHVPADQNTGSTDSHKNENQRYPFQNVSFFLHFEFPLYSLQHDITQEKILSSIPAFGTAGYSFTLGYFFFTLILQ